MSGRPPPDPRSAARTGAGRIYAWVVRLFPRAVRDEYGWEMVSTFEAMLERRRPGGRGPTWAFVLRSCFEGLREGIGARLARRRRDERRVTPHPRERLSQRGREAGMRFSDVVQDVKQAVRNLVRTPGAAAILVATLALGIGANTAIFSVMDGVLFTPLPYDDPEELVTVRHRLANLPDAGLQGVGGPELLDYAGLRSVEAAGGVSVNRTNLTDDEGAARITMGWTTPDFFRVLGVDARLGRVLQPDDWAGAAQERMEDPDFEPPPMSILLSQGLWERRFASDASVLGQGIRVNGQSMTVVGVLPEGFRLLFPGDDGVMERIDAWALMPVPLAGSPRGSFGLSTVARLGDGATLEQARAEMESLVSAWREEHEIHAQRGTEVVVDPLHDVVVGEARDFLWVLFGAVGLLLLIACANVASLLLVRAGAREQEFAIRTALGVGRGRIVRQLLTESLVLALLGTAAGLLLAHWGIWALLTLRPAGLPRVDTVGIDGSVLAFTAGVSVVVALAAGLAPALLSSRVSGSSLLSSRGSVSASRNRLRVRNGLIVTEVALAVVLVVGAGLLFRSFALVRQVDPGFEPEGVASLELALPFFGYRAHDARQAFFDELLRRTRDLPGVDAAGMTAQLPLADGSAGWLAPYTAAGGDLQDPAAPRARYRAITPDFLGTVGARVVRGRDLETRDHAPDARPVVVVDVPAGERIWPGEDPVGRTLRVVVAGYTGDTQLLEAEVVGVVEPVRYAGLTTEVEPTIFVPYAYHAPVDGGLVVRGSADLAAVAAAVRGVVSELDPGVPVYNVRPLTEYVADASARLRYALLLMAVFAGTALVLAAVGLYGVIATGVQQRTREIGVRMALGARREQVSRLVVRDGARLVLPGAVLGVAAALWIGPVLDALLFQVRPADPVTLVVTPTLLALVALVACYAPASRAARLDPVDALRNE